MGAPRHSWGALSQELTTVPGVEFALNTDLIHECQVNGNQRNAAVSQDCQAESRI